MVARLLFTCGCLLLRFAKRLVRWPISQMRFRCCVKAMCVASLVSQAVLSLIEKESVQPQGELICTRTYFPNENQNQKATGKKFVQRQAALGGLCFRKQEGEGVVKVEKNDDVLLVNLGNHPKHCSHLLK